MKFHALSVLPTKLVAKALTGLAVLALGATTHAQTIATFDGDEFGITSIPSVLPTIDGPEIEKVGMTDYWNESEVYCDSGCDGCGKSTTLCCCQPWWAHRCGVFAEYLLLRPGNADMVYTIEQDDVVPGAFPTGPIGRVNIDDSSGGRLGFTLCASQCTSLMVSYTGWQGKTNNTIHRQGDNVLNSQVIHPSTLTVGSSSLQSSAALEMDFQIIDLAYRHVLRATDCSVINWLGGFRYGNMTQDLLAQQDVSVATGLVTVDTDVDFSGFGLLFGLDAERRSCHSGLMCYGKALGSFLAGDWKGSYAQTNQISSGVVANQYEDYRVTPVLEAEFGIGYRSPCGRCRGSVGYMTSAWYDAVSTREYVNAVRTNTYRGVDETITFSGLTARLEANF